MLAWIKHTLALLTTDEDSFRRWAAGVGGLAGGFLAAFPAEAAALAHVAVSPEIIKWAGVALAGGAGGVSPSMLKAPPKP